MSAGLILVQVALVFGGFVCLSAAMDRHEQAIHGKALSAATRSRLRLCGGGALLASLLWVTQWRGSGVGFEVWCLLMTVSAVTVVVLTTYRPAWLAGRFADPS